LIRERLVQGRTKRPAPGSSFAGLRGKDDPADQTAKVPPIRSWHSSRDLWKGRTNLSVTRGQAVFSQGDVADLVFYRRKGRVRLTVVSKTGKEATIAIMSESNFFGRPSPFFDVL